MTGTVLGARGALVLEPRIDPEFHAAIPPLGSDERALLEQNISRDGCRDPLVVWNGILLDGHNRYEICSRLGIDFRIVEVDLPDREAAADWIDANQLGRRNLHPDQFTLLLGRRYNRAKKAEGRPKGPAQKLPQSEGVSTAGQLAAQHHVSRATVERAGAFASAVDKLKATDPEIERKVVAAGPAAPPRQAVVKAAQLLDQAPEKAKAILSGQKSLGEVKREVKADEVRARVELPDAKFRVIYADPPWSYNDKADAGSVQTGGAEHHYPSMSVAELCAMPVGGLCEVDAVLFLWVTSPLLFEAAPVIKAWGFTYKASFVWDKVRHNRGHYNSVRHELLLVCTRGSCTPDVPRLVDSVQSIERTSHSTKPEEFRQIIDSLYPHGKRLELFARRAAQGWASFGHEAVPEVVGA